MDIDPSILRKVVRRALREDIGTGDVTTLSTVDIEAVGQARVVARSRGVAAGLGVLKEVYRQVDPGVEISNPVNDGDRVNPGDTLCELRGSARSLLTGERVALNFLQRMSGVATLTSRFVELAQRTSGAKVRIVDTRKTTPGLRALEKYAVTAGGGHNHRMGLYDAVMIKDNHIVAAGGILPAVKRARALVPHTMTITVECDTLDQVEEALAAGADILLLDNMDNETRSEAVGLARNRALTEASGGIDLSTVASIAATGVDILSIGALTHSPPALDISLDMISVEANR